MFSPAPYTEEKRLEVLRALGILDTPPEERFDRITRLGAALFRVPICLVSLVDVNRQWFKSCVGLSERETPVNVSFCAHAVRQDKLLIIEDAAKDPRFASNPLVTGPPYIRFYAGQPIHAPNSVPLGSFCIIDRVPRSMTPEEVKLLQDLADMAETQLGNFELNRLIQSLRDREVQLARARDEALLLARTKSEFLSIMSHEIRTPIHAMLGTSALMRDTSLDSTQREFLQTIETCGDTLLCLINDILDYSKIEAGKLELETKAFDLAALGKNAALVFGSKAREKNLKLNVEIEPSVPKWVIGDEGRVRQVIYNFLSNAVKFTASGHVTIGMRFEPTSGDEGTVTVSVADTGPGISPVAAKNLFNAYTQADTSISRRFGGTGLGLSITRGLAALMDGSVSVDSELGKGSTFSFNFPARIAPMGPPPPEPVPELSSGRGDIAKLRVLFAEDNGVNRRLGGRMFQSLGLKPDLAADGVEAVALARKNTYDAIFLDIQMPRMDGLEAAAVLQKELGENMPDLVAVTAATLAEDRTRCACAGFKRFLGKPFRIAELAAMLSAIANELPIDRIS